MDRCQNLSYAQEVCRSAAKEEFEAYKANITMNIHHLTRIITKILWEINKMNSIPQINMGSKLLKL